MSIKINPFRNSENLNSLPKDNKNTLIETDNGLNPAVEFSTVNDLQVFAGSLKKAQLFGKLENLNEVNNKIHFTSALSSKVNLGDDDEIIKETKRLIDNYKRKIEPKEIKGAQPAEGSKTAGHARSKHRVSEQVQAEIMNDPERIFSGKRINKNGSERYVDVYYKNGSAIVTEQGDKSKVITAYGLIDKRKPNPKPFNIQKTVDDPNFVEIKLDKLGSATVVYPNKERFKVNDFPPGPPKNNNNPKPNGGNSTPNETLPAKPNAPNNAKPNTSTVTEPTNNPKPVITNEPPTTPKSAALNEEQPVRPSGLGKLAKNVSRGLVVMQLVQLGVAALNYTKLKEDAAKFGYYIDPFYDRYIITDPEKAAKNLDEGFELTFYVDPNDFSNQGKSILFTVKDGKFTNPDGWQLVYNEEKGYTEAILTA